MPAEGRQWPSDDDDAKLMMMIHWNESFYQHELLWSWGGDLAANVPKHVDLTCNTFHFNISDVGLTCNTFHTNHLGI